MIQKFIQMYVILEIFIEQENEQGDEDTKEQQEVKGQKKEKLPF